MCILHLVFLDVEDVDMEISSFAKVLEEVLTILRHGVAEEESLGHRFGATELISFFWMKNHQPGQSRNLFSSSILAILLCFFLKPIGQKLQNVLRNNLA